MPLLESHLEIIRLKHRVETRPLPISDLVSMEDDPVPESRRRGKDRIETVTSALQSWRHQYWLQNCKLCSWSEACLLPDKSLKFLASAGHLRTTEDLKKYVPDWKFARIVGQEVLDVIQITDDAWVEDHEVERSKKRQKSGEKHEQDLEDWNDERRAKTQQRLEAEGKIPSNAPAGRPIWLQYTGAGDKENYERIDKPASSLRTPLTSAQHHSTPPSAAPQTAPPPPFYQDSNGHWWYFASDSHYYPWVSTAAVAASSSTSVASSSAVTLDALVPSSSSSQSTSYKKITWVGGEKKKRATR